MENNEILKEQNENFVNEELNEFTLAKELYTKFKEQNSVINDKDNTAAYLIKTQKLDDLDKRFSSLKYFYNRNKEVPGQFDIEYKNASLSFYETYGSTYEKELEKYLNEKNIVR